MTTAGGIASVSQIAGTACLEQAGYWTQEFLVHLKHNRDYAVERVNGMRGISTVRPEATYLLWIDIRETGVENTAFCDFMQDRVQLALVAGSEKMFGPGGRGYVRLCFATSRAILKEGLDRLERGMVLLRQEKGF